MKLPQFLTRWLACHFALVTGRPVYYHLGPVDNRYMLRWWVVGARSVRLNTERPGGAPPLAPWTGLTGWLYDQITKRFCIRLHHIKRSDRDRTLHDHPAASISLVLENGYWEVLPYQPKDELDVIDYHSQLDLLPYLRTDNDKPYLTEMNIHWRAPGAIVVRRATDSHRIIIPNGSPGSVSLFIMFKRTNKWGFYPDIERGGMRKVPWREYLNIK